MKYFLLLLFASISPIASTESNLIEAPVAPVFDLNDLEQRPAVTYALMCVVIFLPLSSFQKLAHALQKLLFKSLGCCRYMLLTFRRNLRAF